MASFRVASPYLGKFATLSLQERSLDNTVDVPYIYQGSKTTGAQNRAGAVIKTVSRVDEAVSLWIGECCVSAGLDPLVSCPAAQDCNRCNVVSPQNKQVQTLPNVHVRSHALAKLRRPLLAPFASNHAVSSGTCLPRL